VKDLLIIVLVLGLAGVIFHDRQQTNDLTKAQTDNAQLIQQLTESQNAYNTLVAKTRSQSFQRAQPTTSTASQFQLKMSHLQDSGANPLDRPPY